MKKLTKDEFISKAKEIHGDKYDYSKVDYVNSKTKVCIICPLHGEFWQIPANHLLGKNCPECGNINRKVNNILSNEEFVKKAKEVHDDKYDYAKVKYVNSHTKVLIKCNKCGTEFLQTPNKHLNGCGCSSCNGGVLSNYKEFEQKAKEMHNGKYKYCGDYINNKISIKIICPKHGAYYQIPYVHLSNKGCPICGYKKSIPELELCNFIEDLLGKGSVQTRNRNIIKPYELDLFIPSLNIGIEYNGIRWHSVIYQKDNNYHLKKLNECNKKGIKLLSIFEDEWLDNKEIVLGKIRHLIGCDSNKESIYGRKCEIRNIAKYDSKDFLNKYHIQGFVASSIYMGCYYKGELVGVMNFLKEKEGYWNLTRFATKSDYKYCGVASKMLSYFIRNNNPIEIKSFADRRWTLDKDSNLYTKIGFKLDKTLPPDYRYYFPKEYSHQRIHKFNFRKNKLSKKYNLPLTLTEREMCEQIGAYRIYDCGLFKYVWKKDFF